MYDLVARVIVFQKDRPIWNVAKNLPINSICEKIRSEVLKIILSVPFSSLNISTQEVNSIQCLFCVKTVSN
jgi:hypothetical protein